MSVDTRFHAELRQRLGDRKLKLAEELASGSVVTIEAYREQVGYIRALKDVLDVCIEVETKVTGGN